MSEEWSNDTLTTKMKILCESVKNLKKLRPITWGSVALFSVLVVIGGGMRADVKDAHSAVKTVREQHVEEFRELQNSIKAEMALLKKDMNSAFYDIGKDLGRNEALHIESASNLKRIEEKVDRLLEEARK